MTDKYYIMHFTKVVHLLWVAWLTVSCNHVSRREGIDAEVKKYELKASARQELFMSNGKMAATDSFLVVGAFLQSDVCRVYAMYDNMKEYLYGKIGNGPHEYIQPLLTYGYGNEFALNDVNQQMLSVVEVASNGTSPEFKEKKRLKAPYKRKKGELVPFDYYFVRLDDGHYVSLVGVKTGSFFTLSDSTLSPVCRFGESPIEPSMEEELSVISARNRLNGKIVAHDGCMVYAATSLPYLACYEKHGDAMEKKWSFYYATTRYGVRNDDLLFDKETAIGPMLDVKMDARYIYLLYMDRLYSEYDSFDSEKSCSDKVVVFDYEGNRVAALHLDIRIKELAVCSKILKLYGIAQHPDMSLVTFDLPEELYE